MQGYQLGTGLVREGFLCKVIVELRPGGHIKLATSRGRKVNSVPTT